MPERFHAGSTNQSTSYFFRSSGFTPTTDSNMKSLLMSEIIDTVIADAPKQTLHFTLAFLCRECGVFFFAGKSTELLTSAIKLTRKRSTASLHVFQGKRNHRAKMDGELYDYGSFKFQDENKGPWRCEV